MRVQLSEKSKAEFIELIAKDSITCWFEGDEFVMPSGQGKTAKGIVLGKLLVWQHQQSKVDEITQLYAKELFNKKVVAKKASEKLAGLQLQNDELQKRVDEQGLIIANVMSIASELQKSWEVFEIGKKLEQALKGGGDE